MTDSKFVVCNTRRERRQIFPSNLCVRRYSSMNFLRIIRLAPPCPLTNAMCSCWNSLSPTESMSAKMPGLSARSAGAPAARVRDFVSFVARQ